MLYEIADANGTTVGELTGTRRRYSTITIPEQLARLLGAEDVGEEEDRTLVVEHFDEGLSSSEIPFINALWELKHDEQKSNNS